ncbi:hypothetical protein POTOM_035707 [Populus tomentosa]|uniref:Uncharacterized protein n=1 Tax=Populus tomentosa TaxID=118781 RepID=A0A8X7Z975_POPTO|nr:hypothetical protein POTOM_035707 [Populus tomentosa]
MRNSCLPEIDNASAMMTLDENPQCSFQILRPAAKKQIGVGSTVTAKSGTIPHKIKVVCLGEPWSFVSVGLSGGFIARGVPSHRLSFPFSLETFTYVLYVEVLLVLVVSGGI